MIKTCHAEWVYTYQVRQATILSQSFHAVTKMTDAWKIITATFLIAG